jgi:hypothetical protein
MRGAHGADPVVALVADEKHLKLAVGLQGGLEVMGLTVLTCPTVAALAEAGSKFDHMVVVASFDDPDDDPNHTHTEPTSAQRRADRYARHIFPSPRQDDPVNWQAAMELVDRLCERGIASVQIVPFETGFRVCELTDGRADALGDFASPSLEGLAQAMLELCLMPGTPMASLGDNGLFLMRRDKAVVEVAVGIERSGEALAAVDLQMRPLTIEHMHPTRIPVGRLDAAALSEDDDDEDAETHTVAAPIQRIVSTIHQQAIRDGAHRIVMVPAEMGVRVDFSIGDYDFEIMSVPKQLREPVTQRLRVMADLWLADRRVAQRGRYVIRHNGVDYQPEVTIIPTDAGERIEIVLEPDKLPTLPADTTDDAVPSDLNLQGKTVLLLGNSKAVPTLWPRWSARGVKRVITSTGTLDAPSLLLFALTFYRSLIRQNDERAAFKKAKSTVFSGEEVKLLDQAQLGL